MKDSYGASPCLQKEEFEAGEPESRGGMKDSYGASICSQTEE